MVNMLSPYSLENILPFGGKSILHCHTPGNIFQYISNATRQGLEKTFLRRHFQCILLNVNIRALAQILLKFVSMGQFRYAIIIPAQYDMHREILFMKNIY